MPPNWREGKVSYIRREAMEQTAAGAHLLDVNVGAPGIDEPAAMERAVFCVSGAVTCPLVLDSSNPEALERGLKAADGKVLVNSVSGEEKSLARILPLVEEVRCGGDRPHPGRERAFPKPAKDGPPSPAKILAAPESAGIAGRKISSSTA